MLVVITSLSWGRRPHPHPRVSSPLFHLFVHPYKSSSTMPCIHPRHQLCLFLEKPCLFKDLTLQQKSFQLELLAVPNCSDRACRSIDSSRSFQTFGAKQLAHTLWLLWKTSHELDLNHKMSSSIRGWYDFRIMRMSFLLQSVETYWATAS